MTPQLPQPITVEGNRLMYTRAQLLAYGRACFVAGQVSQPAPKPAPKPVDDDLSKLFKAFGMTP